MSETMRGPNDRPTTPAPVAPEPEAPEEENPHLSEEYKEALESLKEQDSTEEDPEDN